MKSIAFVVAALACLSLTGAPTAQPPASKGNDAAIIANEKSMWEMWKRKDAKSFGALLADDFYDVYLSGETAGKEELLRGFADADLLDYQLSPLRTVALSPDASLLLYRAHVKGRVAGKELEYDVDVTSVWAIRKGVGSRCSTARISFRRRCHGTSWRTREAARHSRACESRFRHSVSASFAWHL